MSKTKVRIKINGGVCFVPELKYPDASAALATLYESMPAKDKFQRSIYIESVKKYLQ